MEQSCHRCCRDPKNASALCEPHPGSIFSKALTLGSKLRLNLKWLISGAADLKDGTWCIKGVCKNSKCTTEVTDQVVNLLNVLSDGNRFCRSNFEFSPTRVVFPGNFVVSNMVGIIIVLFCCLWFPAGFIVRKWVRFRIHPFSGISSKFLHHPIIIMLHFL